MNVYTLSAKNCMAHLCFGKPLTHFCLLKAISPPLTDSQSMDFCRRTFLMILRKIPTHSGNMYENFVWVSFAANVPLWTLKLFWLFHHLQFRNFFFKRDSPDIVRKISRDCIWTFIMTGIPFNVLPEPPCIRLHWTKPWNGNGILMSKNYFALCAQISDIHCNP